MGLAGRPGCGELDVADRGFSEGGAQEGFALC